MASAPTVEREQAPVPAPPAPDGRGPAAAAKLPEGKRPGRLRRIILPILVLLLLGAIAVGFNIWYQDAHFVATDNAQVGGQPVNVGPMSAGRVSNVRTVVGAAVHQGDILAQVELPTAVKTYQNGQPDLQFLGTADQFVDITAPINGVVIAVPGAVGSTVSQGQTVVTLIDPANLWVNANVDETKAARLRIGQEADVHLDALNQDVVGKVTQLTPATAGSFSLLPQSNTTTNFTKVGQVVPVRIGVELSNRAGMYGSSAEVKIHVG